MNFSTQSFRASILLAALGAIMLLVASLPASAFFHPDSIVPNACRPSQNASFFKSAAEGGCTICHIGVLVINFTKILMLAIALPAVALLVAISGIMILTAGGSEQRLKQGKDILRATIIGIIIVFLAWLAVDTVIKVLTLGGSQFIGTFGPWYQLPVESCGI